MVKLAFFDRMLTSLEMALKGTKVLLTQGQIFGVIRTFDQLEKRLKELRDEAKTQNQINPSFIVFANTMFIMKSEQGDSVEVDLEGFLRHVPMPLLKRLHDKYWEDRLKVQHEQETSIQSKA